MSDAPRPGDGRRFVAGFAVAVSGAAVLLLAVSALFFPITRDEIRPSRGAEIFQANCSGCHSLERGGAALRGPNLYGLEDWAGTRVEGLGPEEYVYQSIVDPEAYRQPGTVGAMPRRFASELPRDALLDVVAFLTGGTEGPRYRTLLALPEPEGPSAEDETRRPRLDLATIESGRPVFARHCSTCHDLEVGENYDLYYPNLENIGVHGEAWLRESILEPSAVVQDAYASWIVRGPGDELVTGRLMHTDDDTTTLVVSTEAGFAPRTFETQRLLPFADGERLQRSPVSDMPPIGLVLSEDELSNLIDFLRFLRT